MNTQVLSDFTDAELISNYKQTNNSEVIGILYLRYAHLIFGVCMKYLKNEEEAKDAAMEIVEKIQKELLKHDILLFSAWLHMVCKNFCLMKLRSDKSKKRNEAFMQADFAGIVEIDIHVHQQNGLQKEMLLTQMEECLKNLNEEQKLCLELFYLQEKSYVEVAEHTTYSMNNVKSYIQNGKRNLKICIEAKQ